MKTPVEQFAIALYEGGYLQGNGDKIQQLLEEHLEIEREQIEQAFEIGADSYYDLRQPSSCIQYYNETYGGNKC
jgi:hypothetical protein